MNAEENTSLARKYLKQAMNGQSVENPKLDFKRQWYDLKDLKGKSEFFKDTTAIANTVGPDGLIIIGFDEKKREFQDAKFTDSKLGDTNEILGLLSSNVDRIFDINCIDFTFERHTLSLLHIPPSLDKPHIIKKHYKKDKENEYEENKIFVRSGTTTRVANRADIELMIYDRKNIIPDYVLNSFATSVIFSNVPQGGTDVVIITLLIENFGRKPLAIKNIIEGSILIKYKGLIDLKNPVELEHGKLGRINHLNFIIKSNDLIKRTVRFDYDSVSMRIVQSLGPTTEMTSQQIEEIKLKYLLTNGKVIENICELTL